MLSFISSILSLFDTSRYHRCLAFFRTVYISLSEICSLISVWPPICFSRFAVLCCQHIHEPFIYTIPSKDKLFIYCYRIDSWPDRWALQTTGCWVLPLALQGSGQTMYRRTVSPLHVTHSDWRLTTDGRSCDKVSCIYSVLIVSCSFLSGFRTEFYFDCKVTFQNRLCCNCNICTFPCWKLTINYLNIVFNLFFHPFNFLGSFRAQPK